MTFIAVGINYNTAPVAIRERLAFPSEILTSSLQQLSQQHGIHEAAILSTCNRTELYCRAASNNQNILVDWIAANKNIDPSNFRPYLYTHTDRSVYKHIFRVACGLDSMMLGEPQILGQIKSAYQAAYTAGTLGKQLGRLFQHTFSTASKVRTDTKIGYGAISVAFAAVKLAAERAQQINGALGAQTALLIGAGETIELIARHLAQHNVKRILIANRTYDKAHELATQFNGTALELSELPSHLHEADIIISSTASQLPILGKGCVESALKKRKYKRMYLLDLAVPRDIEPEIDQLEHAYLDTIDDIQTIIAENRDQRRLAAEQAEDIIDKQVNGFLAWLNAQHAQSTIQDYRAQAEQHRDESLKKALALLQNGVPPEVALNRLAHSLTNKLIHTPSAQIREAAQNERHDLLHAARDIFKLPPTR